MWIILSILSITQIISFIMIFKLKRKISGKADRVMIFGNRKY